MDAQTHAKWTHAKWTHAKWMTLPEIALARRISLDDARRLVDGSDCAKVFRADGTVYLI